MGSNHRLPTYDRFNLTCQKSAGVHGFEPWTSTLQCEAVPSSAYDENNILTCRKRVGSEGVEPSTSTL